MAGDTRGSDTVHTRYARKGTPTAMHVGQRMPSLELSHQGRQAVPSRLLMCQIRPPSAGSARRSKKRGAIASSARAGVVVGRAVGLLTSRSS